MFIEATPKKAFLTGISAGSVLILIETFEKRCGLTEGLAALFFWTAAFLLILVPAMFFVVGRQNLFLRLSERYTPKYWKDLPQIVARILCWFVGASLAQIVSALFAGEIWH